MGEYINRGSKTRRRLLAVGFAAALCGVAIAQSHPPEGNGETVAPDNTRVGRPLSSKDTLGGIDRGPLDSLESLTASSECLLAVSDLCRGNPKDAKQLLVGVLETPYLDSIVARDAHHYLGRTEMILGNYDRAETSFRTSLRFDPQHTESEIGLMIALGYQGEFPDAERALRALVGGTKDSMAEYLLAAIWFELKDFALVKRHCEAALGLNPTHRNSLIMLSQCLFTSGEPSAGEQILLRMGKEWSQVPDPPSQESTARVLVSQ